MSTLFGYSFHTVGHEKQKAMDAVFEEHIEEEVCNEKEFVLGSRLLTLTVIQLASKWFGRTVCNIL